VVVLNRRCCLGSCPSGLLFCRAGLLLAAAGVVSGSLRFQLCLGLAQNVESILAALQFLGQLIATLALAVARVFLGVDQLGLVQQRCDLGFQLGLGLSIRSWLIASCLEALALTLVPSRATLPRLTRPAFWHSLSTCTNRPANASR